VSLTAAYFLPNFQFSDGEHPTRWRTSDTSMVYHQVRTCVRSQPPVPYPGVLIPASPRYEVGKGAAFDTAAHVRLRGISDNSCALRSRVFGHQACAYRPPLAFQVVRSQYLLLGGFEIAQLAAVECAATATRARRLACNAAGSSAKKSERGLSYVVRDAEMRNCAAW
jgi:hypothetical protein